MRHLLSACVLSLLAILAFGAATTSYEGQVEQINMDLHTHTRELADDAYEGRGPGTAGELKTIEYLSREFARLGLKPGNEGSWYQDVPTPRNRVVNHSAKMGSNIGTVFMKPVTVGGFHHNVVRSFNQFRITEGLHRHVSIGIAQCAAVATVENPKGVNPFFRRGTQDPATVIVAPRITFREKDILTGRTFDVSGCQTGNDLPPTRTVDAIETAGN